MNRRDMMLAAAAAAGLAPAAYAPAAYARAAGLRAAAREAWLYGLPLIEMAATRARGAIGGGLAGDDAAPAAANRLQHARRLAGPESRAVTTPNNDTLYSTAWIDLSRGPLTLTLPPTGTRYISAAVMNMFTDNEVLLGTRTTGGAGGRYTLVGPGQAGAGPGVVRLSTPQGWLLVRTLVDGEADLPAVHRVQDGLKLEGPTGMTWPAAVPRTAPALDYFAAVAALLRANPPPATDQALFARIAPLGLTGAGGFDPARFDAARLAEVEAGVGDARLMLRMAANAGRAIEGWTYPPTRLGFYGQDYPLRAAVALAGLAALPPAEAMYLNPQGDAPAGGPGAGRMFVGDAYRLHFPAGRLPPVDAFWSLTLYEATPEGQFFLVENPVRRYAIGDRTPGLARNPDGSLDIWISRADPGGVRSANWLPAPRSGPFTLSLRAYLPKPDLLDGRWRAPPVTRV